MEARGKGWLVPAAILAFTAACIGMVAMNRLAAQRDVVVSGANSILTLPGHWKKLPPTHSYSDLSYASPSGHEIVEVALLDFESIRNGFELEDMEDAVLTGFRKGYSIKEEPAEVSINGYRALRRAIHVTDGGFKWLGFFMVLEGRDHYFLIWTATHSANWGSSRERLLKISNSFRCPGDLIPHGEAAPDPEPEPKPQSKPRPEPQSKASASSRHDEQAEDAGQAYIRAVEAIRSSVTLEHRHSLVKAWCEDGLHTVPGAWRDLVLALSSSPTDGRIDALVFEQLARCDVTTPEAVECLPLAALKVRRALTARLAALTGSEREAAVEALLAAPDERSPGILEALMLLGQLNSTRVDHLVRVEGTDWANEPALRTQLLAACESEPEFVPQLLSARDAEVRVLGCSLVTHMQSEGDAQLKLVLPLLRDAMNDVRSAAADTLAKLKNPRASWGLARGLARETDPYASERMLIALAGSDSTATLGLIVRLQARDSADDQRGAAIALRAFSAAEALTALQRTLASKHEPVLLAGLESVLTLVAREGPEALQACLAPVEALEAERASSLGQARAEALAALRSQ